MMNINTTYILYSIYMVDCGLLLLIAVTASVTLYLSPSLRSARSLALAVSFPEDR